MRSPMEQLLGRVDGWGAAHAAAAVVGPMGIEASHGDVARSFSWASVTKPVTALVAAIAVERGLIDLDEAAGPTEVPWRRRARDGPIRACADVQTPERPRRAGRGHT